MTTDSSSLCARPLPSRHCSEGKHVRCARAQLHPREPRPRQQARGDRADDANDDVEKEEQIVGPTVGGHETDEVGSEDAQAKPAEGRHFSSGW